MAGIQTWDLLHTGANALTTRPLSLPMLSEKHDFYIAAVIADKLCQLVCTRYLLRTLYLFFEYKLMKDSDTMKTYKIFRLERPLKATGSIDAILFQERSLTCIKNTQVHS